MCTWTNPPLALLAGEVDGHARFAVHQALAAPEIEIRRAVAVSLGADTWRVEVGIVNTGWLPTSISQKAKDDRLVLPLTAEISGATVVGQPARIELGQLEGRLGARFRHGNDGTPDRVLTTWIVQAAAGTEVRVAVWHQRAGSTEATVVLAP